MIFAGNLNQRAKVKTQCLFFQTRLIFHVESEEDELLAQKNEPPETQKTVVEVLVTHLKLVTNTKLK